MSSQIRCAGRGQPSYVFKMVTVRLGCKKLPGPLPTVAGDPVSWSTAETEMVCWPGGRDTEPEMAQF